MVSEAALPDDIDALKQLVHQLARENTQQKQQIELLQEQLNLAIQKRFAARSEKHSPDQLGLFNEAEETAEQDEAAADNLDEKAQSIEVPAHQRKKPGRKPLPESLPRVEVIHDLDETDKTCPHDGEALKHIGDEISEQLDIIPAKIQVLRHIRRKYACPCCQQGVKTASLPKQPIPKSQASPGLLAYIIVSKYADALPLYRQSKIFERIGVSMNRTTLANWMIQCGQLVQPLINLMRDKVLDYDIVQMDETRIQVLKENGRAAQSQSWMWVQRGGPPDKRLILYHYDPGRHQQVPKYLLPDYRGYLQTDGYDGYNAVAASPDIIHIGCLAHARRKFDEALKAQKKNKPKNAPTSKAQMGLATIQKLYRIEKRYKDSTPEERYQARQKYGLPVLQQLRDWLDKSLPQVAPKSLTGKALHYLNNQWAQLIRYCDDGRLEIDNNGCERAVRPFAIGRKNWLFSQSVNGAKASANLYSLMETAKANGLEPYSYLRKVLSELPKAETVEQIEALLPVTPE